MIRETSRHRRGHAAPVLGRAVAILGGERTRQLLAQPAMRATEMVIGKGQRELILQVRAFPGEGIDFSPQAPGMLANGHAAGGFVPRRTC